MKPYAERPYRPGVGIMLLNAASVVPCSRPSLVITMAMRGRGSLTSNGRALRCQAGSALSPVCGRNVSMTDALWVPPAVMLPVVVAPAAVAGGVALATAIAWVTGAGALPMALSRSAELASG